ncbi:hypothetical protein MASR1M107_09880 [Ignavibacteriales bacterium]
MSDSLKIITNETLEIILQSTAAERDQLLTKQNQLDANGKKSLTFFEDLYSGVTDLKSAKLETALQKLEKAANNSDRSLLQLDASWALGCYSILKNEGENAWLYLDSYSEMLTAKYTTATNLSDDVKDKIEMKKTYLARLRANFK